MAVGLGVIPQFPASVAVGAGLTLAQANGIFTFGTDIGNASYAATAAPNVRLTSNRARDFVRLIDFIPIGAGYDLKDAFPGAMAALTAKAGGKLDCTGYRKSTQDVIDLGSGSLLVANSSITLAGDGRTTIISTAATGPIVSIGDGSLAGIAASGMEGINVIASNTVARTDPVVWLRNGQEVKLDHVVVNSLGTASGGIAFQVDGGPFNYNTRLIGVRAYAGSGGFINSLVVGKNAEVAGLYLLDGFSFGGCTGSNILIYNVSGCQINNGESISGNRSLEMAPGVGQKVSSVQMSNVQFDSSQEIGWLMRDTGGEIENVTATNIWNCTHGRVLVGGLYHEGLRIEGSVGPASWGASGSHITNIEIMGLVNGNCGASGITTLNCDDVRFTGAHVNGNGAATAGNGYDIGAGSRNVAIAGGSARGRFNRSFQTTPFQIYGATVAADTASISVTGFADFSGNVTGPLNNSSSNGSTNSLVLGTGYHA